MKFDGTAFKKLEGLCVYYGFPPLEKTSSHISLFSVWYDAESLENRVLSIVLSQDKKSNDHGYTLSSYCTEEFLLGRPELGLSICQTING